MHNKWRAHSIRPHIVHVPLYQVAFVLCWHWLIAWLSCFYFVHIDFTCPSFIFMIVLLLLLLLNLLLLFSLAYFGQLNVENSPPVDETKYKKTTNREEFLVCMIHGMKLNGNCRHLLNWWLCYQNKLPTEYRFVFFSLLKFLFLLGCSSGGDGFVGNAVIIWTHNKGITLKQQWNKSQNKFTIYIFIWPFTIVGIFHLYYYYYLDSLAPVGHDLKSVRLTTEICCAWCVRICACIGYIVMYSKRW